MITQTYIGTLIVETCVNCGTPFGLDRDLYNKLRESHGTFYCPKGHSQYYSAKSETEKLKDEISQQNQRLERLNNYITEKNQTIHSLTYSNRSLKAAKTKILNRVKNGVCPCCNRTFKNLQAHFKTVHPEIVNPGN